MDEEENPTKKESVERDGVYDNKEEENTTFFDGKKLHDLYRHTTKLIK